MMDREVIQRIAKLLELAKSPCNEFEAARAAEKAQELLEVHNLSLGEVEFAAQPSAEAHYLCPRNPPRYLWILVSCVEMLFDCVSILTAEGLFGPTCIALCGVPQNVEAAVLTLHYLHDSIRALERGRRDLLVVKRRNSRRANYKRRLSYYYGAACRVHHSILQARVKSEQNANRQAIVQVGNALAQRHMKEHYPKRVTVRQRKANVDDRAASLGYSDGARIDAHGVHRCLPEGDSES
jgi:hypothetical protein